MRKLFLLIVVLTAAHICFSQIIQDPFSGIKMELSDDRQYLTVVNIKAGSPADLAPLKLGDRIFSINSQPVGAISDCPEYFRNYKDYSIQFVVGRFNELKIPVTIQRASIDLFPGNIVSEAELFNSAYPIQLRVLSKDISIEKDNFDHLDEIIQATGNTRAYSVSSFNESAKACFYYIKLNAETNNEISILVDESKNLMNFKTFDFDYTSVDESLLEKNLLNKLEKQLTGLGLVRNTVNPDILIIISFYSGQKEQYVPPQQIISTKIQSYFNWYWGYIPIPVTESETKEGYTKVTYLTNINLKLLDVKEIPTSKVPPVLWSASYSELSPEKVFISDCADRVFSSLLLQFPKVVNENCKNLKENTYTYTGIIYNKLNPAIIADVLPGSPAYQAGMRKGDAILKISDRKLPEEFSSGTLTFYWQNRSDYDNALKYLFMQTDLRTSPTGLFNALKSDYKDYQSPEGTPVVFEIKRNGKKMEFGVIPEFKKAVFFENAGFTL
jgi:membrane-associated protease RseP (regulator of RpoE activity)